MVDVFVSYASQDRERVKPIVAALERHGWTVWWDRQIDAGTTFDREIEKAIDQATCIVVVWSHYSVESEWVRTEANEGLDRKCLVPTSIEDVKPPLAFRRVQTIKMSEADAQLQLVNAVSRFAPPPVTESGDYTPFIGRQAETRQLEQELIRIFHGNGTFILLSGEAGVGKTRLTLETGNAAREKGCLVLSGHCMDMAGAPPYQPLLEQIEQTIRLMSPENFREALGENAPEVAKLMPELRQIYDDIPEPVSLPPDQERRYLLHGVGEYIDRAARMQPLVLIFEDLHWADDSTCILLRHLANRLKESRVLLVGTYRDSELDHQHPFAHALQDLNRERLVEELVLKRFDRDGVKAMLEGQVGKTPPTELVDLVFSETEGNPFFVEELFRHLMDSGKLLNDEGEFASGIDIADTEVPRGIRLIIGERLERVSETCRAVLALGAVVDRDFGFDLLLRADPKLDEDALLDAIDEAETANLIEDLSREREARYGFVHEQIRQTLLASLSFPRRQRLHLRVAQGLEDLLGDRADRSAGTIAHHLYQAGAAANADKTVHYLAVAAERANDALAFEDAVRYLDMAISIISEGDGEVNVRLLGRKAMALQGSGLVEDALTALAEAVETADSEDLKDELILQKGKMMLDVWRGHEALEDLERLLARAGAEANRRKELEVLQWLGKAYYQASLDRSGFSDKTKETYDRTIQLARELGEREILGFTLVQTNQQFDLGAEDVGKNLAEAEQIARETGNEDIEIEAATARLNTRKYRETDEYGEVVLEKLLTRSDPVRLNAHYFRMMWTSLSAGRLARCVELCDAGIELAYRIGTLPVQYPSIKAMALMELGSFADAWQSIGEEIADAEHRFGAAHQELVTFQFELNCGAVDGALKRAAHVISEAKFLSRGWMLGSIRNSLAYNQPWIGGDKEKLKTANELIEDTGAQPGRIGTAALNLASGDTEECIRGLESIVAADSHALQVRSRCSALLLMGQALQMNEMPDRALQTVRQGIEICQSHNMRYSLWQMKAVEARAHHALDNEKSAADSHNEAVKLHGEIADTIQDESYRNAFKTGLMAKFHAV